MAGSELPNSVIRDETRAKLGLVTPEELSVTLEVTTTTLQTWRCEGKGPRFIKLGKGVFYRIVDVKAWIDEAVAPQHEIAEEVPVLLADAPVEVVPA